MIHIKGTWRQSNLQLVFLGDNFFLTKNNEEIIKDKFTTKGCIKFKTDKNTFFLYERKYFNRYYLKYK
jgi:hypothetical protein